MDQLIPVLSIAALLGSAVVAGVFFAFSTLRLQSKRWDAQAYTRLTGGGRPEAAWDTGRPAVATAEPEPPATSSKKEEAPIEGAIEGAARVPEESAANGSSARVPEESAG